MNLTACMRLGIAAGPKPCSVRNVLRYTYRLIRSARCMMRNLRRSLRRAQVPCLGEHKVAPEWAGVTQRIDQPDSADSGGGGEDDASQSLTVVDESDGKVLPVSKAAQGPSGQKSLWAPPGKEI